MSIFLKQMRELIKVDERNLKVANAFFALVIVLGLSSSQIFHGQVTGRVFQDYNANGVYDINKTIAAQPNTAGQALYVGGNNNPDSCPSCTAAFNQPTPVHIPFTNWNYLRFGGSVAKNI